MNTNEKAHILDELIVEEVAEVERLRQRLASQVQFVSELQQRREALPSVAQNETPVLSAPVTNGDGMEAGRTPQHIVEILRAADGPLSIHVIADRLGQRGVESTAVKGLKSTVSAALTRRKDLFVRVGKAVWDLQERQER